MTAAFTAVIPRHRWVHVDPVAHVAIAASCSDAQLREHVADWLARGLPLISRARLAHDYVAHPVGLCLKRRRVALSVDASAVTNVEEPTVLAEVAETLAPRAAAAALALCHGARSLGFEPRAFGSASWQHRTGDTYLHATSDLDILAAPASRDALTSWLELLTELEPTSPMRLDGEVELPSGEAVNWRELAAAPRQVLLKSSQGARLAATHAVWELFR